MDKGEALRALRAPGERHKRAKDRLNQAREELRPYVQEARLAGVPIRSIVAETGLSQSTIAVWEAEARGARR